MPPKRLVRRFGSGFESAGLDEIVSFTVPQNRQSWRVMEKIGLIRDPAGDFDHAEVDPAVHPDLVHHVMYRLRQEQWAARSHLPRALRWASAALRRASPREMPGGNLHPNGTERPDHVDDKGVISHGRFRHPRGARTPIGKLSGAPRRLLRRQSSAASPSRPPSSGPGSRGDQVDYVFMGQVLQAGAGQITARQAAVKAGIPMTRPVHHHQQGLPLGPQRDPPGRPR